MLALLINDRHRSTQDAVTNTSTSARTSATPQTRRPLSSRSGSTQPLDSTHSNPNPRSFSRTVKAKPKPKLKPKPKPMAIFPRSPNYERLEGGMMMGPSSTNPHQSSKWNGKWTPTWRKYVIATAVLLVFVWLYKGYHHTNYTPPHNNGQQWGLPVKAGDYRELFFFFTF